MKKLFFAFVVVLFGTLVCNAAEIDGKWKTTIKGQDGDMELVFVFKADGATLTGSIVSPMGELPITNGKVDGKEFSFDLDLMGNTIKHKGTVEGNEIKMKSEGGPGGDGTVNELILKKSVE
ncbi:MAG: hypothetical protein K0M50_13230 [Prolixibacteraceae bacterium]|nr:hypothetical protein [Prolixibacteraceae bacterium]